MTLEGFMLLALALIYIVISYGDSTDERAADRSSANDRKI
jgi:hypothetical protein